MGVACVLAMASASVEARAGDASGEKQACIAAAEQGQSQRDDGKYRAARESFVACAADACPRVIAQSCTKWLREVDESAPTIVLGAKDTQGNDLTDVKVTFDGVDFAAALDGKPRAADVGEHVLRFQREGSLPVQQKLFLRAGEKARVVSVTMRAPGDVAEVSPKPETHASPAEPLSSARHVAAGAVAIAAVIAAGVAVALVVKSNDDEGAAASIRDRLASPQACRTGTAGALSADCRSLSSTVTSQYNEVHAAEGLFVGAGALVGCAAAIWLLWPTGSPREAAPAATLIPLRGGGVLQMSGQF